MDEALRRRRLTLLLVPIACLVVAPNVGNAFFPTLSTNHPLLLLALDARNRNRVLVANQIDAVPYFLVGGVRLLAADPLFYLLGYWFGETALRWVEERSGSGGRFLRAMERFFAKAAYPLVFLAPNNYFCLFAGASRMPPPAFLILNISGTVVRLIAIRAVGDLFDEPIDEVLGFLTRYRWPLTALTVSIVVAQVLLDRRRGTGELASLADLEDAVEHEAEEPAGEDATPASPTPRSAGGPGEPTDAPPDGR